ncbi:MAG: hypothetical protein C4297_08865 [Gemmataceae bacterium]
MGKRRDRFDLRKTQMKEARSRNAPRKIAERVRRDQRIQELLKSCQPPYPRIVRQWLARRLDKPEKSITAEDVQKVLTGMG